MHSNTLWWTFHDFFHLGHSWKFQVRGLIWFESLSPSPTWQLRSPPGPHLVLLCDSSSSTMGHLKVLIPACFTSWSLFHRPQLNSMLYFFSHGSCTLLTATPCITGSLLSIAFLFPRTLLLIFLLKGIKCPCLWSLTRTPSDAIWILSYGRDDCFNL